MSTTLILTKKPQIEPISLVEAKNYLKIDNNFEDGLIEMLISSARTHVETTTRRSLIEQNWRLVIDDKFTGNTIKLPRPPIIKIIEITGYGRDGKPIIINPDHYRLKQHAENSELKFNSILVICGFRNGIEVDYTAGYGDNPGDVPAGMRQAIMALVAHWYERREIVSQGLSSSIVPLSFTTLIEPYRVMKL